jgi:hypothetical protein
MHSSAKTTTWNIKSHSVFPLPQMIVAVVWTDPVGATDVFACKDAVNVEIAQWGNLTLISLPPHIKTLQDKYY